MSTEVYSKRLAVHVRNALRQADGERFAELLTYYRQRGGPGLGLAEQEATARAARHQLNYQVATHTTVGAPPPQPP